jgi:hypothetical protein
LFVTLALVLALAVVYTPGLVRAWKFRTVNAMLDDIKAGKVRNIPNYVLAEQKPAVTQLVMFPLVPHYAKEIGSLKLTSYYKEEDHVWAVVTGKQKDGTFAGQGKLRWVWNGKQWQFDALNSYVNRGIGVREEDAQNIGELMEGLLSNKPGADLEEVIGQ